MDCFVAQGQSQAVSKIDLCQCPFQEIPDSTHPVAGFRPHQNMTWLAPKLTQIKRDLGRHRTTWVNSASCSSPCTAAFKLWSGSNFTGSHSEGQPHAWKGQHQLKINYNRRDHVTHTRNTPEGPAQMIQEAVFLSPIVHIPYRATLLRLKNIAD